MTLLRVPGVLLLRSATTHILLLTVSLALVPSHARAADPPLTAEQWRQDLHYLVQQMESKHRNLYAYVNKEDFAAAVKALDARIPQLQPHQVIVELGRIVAMVGDGHTRLRYLDPWNDLPKPLLPIDLYWFSDGLYIARADRSVARLAGARVLRLGDVTADEALRRAQQVIPKENEFDSRARVTHVLRMTEVLDALGLSKGLDGARFTIEKDGKVETVTLASRMTLPRQLDWVDSIQGPKPLWLQHTEEPYWYQYLPDERLLYIQYNEVRSKPDDPTDKFFPRAYQVANENPVEKLVLDIRRNGGGNNYLNKPVLLGAIKSKLDEHGKFFTIIGRQTFSAAMNLTNQLERFTQTTFVGEPTGERVNFYGDPVTITAPNSKLQVSASTLWWQDQDPRDTRPYLAPQLAADLSFADYKAGRDSAMEVILHYKAEEPITDVIRREVQARHPELALQAAKRYLANPLYRYQNLERPINQLGYEFVVVKDLDRAIAVFQLNTELYPEAFNTWDSLAETYAARGERDAAIKYYEKSLALNPNSATGQAALAGLRASGNVSK